MTKKEALAFLALNQPMPNDYDITQELINKYNNVRLYFSDETWRVEVSSSRLFRLPFQNGFLVTRHPFRFSYFIHIKLFR